MSAPVSMVSDTMRALEKHGVVLVKQDHMNQLIKLLGEMLDFSREMEGGGR